MGHFISDESSARGGRRSQQPSVNPGTEEEIRVPFIQEGRGPGCP